MKDAVSDCPIFLSEIKQFEFEFEYGDLSNSDIVNRWKNNGNEEIRLVNHTRYLLSYDMDRHVL